MCFSIFNVIAAIIWSSLMVAFVFFARKSPRLKPFFGIRTIAVCYVLSSLRMLLPIGFRWEIAVNDWVVYPKVYDALVLRNLGQNIPTTFTRIFCVVWVVVACFLVLRFSYAYRAAKRFLIKEGTACTPAERAVFKTIQKESKRSIPITLLRSRQMDVPIGCGLHYRYILLPDRGYSENELYYTLLHEYTHFLNRDIWVKTWISLFSCIFWWNPFVHLLERDLEQTLELKCDYTVASRLSKAQRADYLQTILSAVQRGRKPVTHHSLSTALVGVSTADSVRERFMLVAEFDEQAMKKKTKLILAGVFTVLIGISYLFVFQPAYAAPKYDEMGSRIFGADDSYILHTMQGSYELYVEDELFEVMDAEQAQMFAEDGFRIQEEGEKPWWQH